METQLRQVETDLKLRARLFAREHFQDGPYYDREELFPESIWRAAGKEGLLGAFIPPQYNGHGVGYLAHTLVMEEFWRVDPGIGNILLSVFGSELLLGFGGEGQKSKWLPKLAEGSAISCCAITEPDAGSDIFGISTLAVHEADRWKINGTKQFITNGNRADLIFVFAVTDPRPTDRTTGYSIFLMEKDSSGLSAEKMTGKMGIRGSDTAELNFSDVLVPETALLGEESGKGFFQIMNLFNINRLFACGQGVGVAQGGLDQLLRHLRERPEKSRSQRVLFKLADIGASVNAARQIYIRAGLNLDRGIVDPGGIAMAKLVAGETGVTSIRDCLTVLGAEAAANDHPLSRFYRDAKIVEIYEGAKDLEKLTIARQLLADKNRD